MITHLIKKISLVITGLLLSAGAIAQSDGASDSLLTYHPAVTLFKRASQSVAGLESYVPTSVAVVSLKGTTESGGLRTEQVPQKHSVISFETEGIKQVNKIKLFGKFTYSRTWDDSLSWSQMGIPDDNRPFYLAAEKAGRYDRQFYNMNGRIAYALKPEKFFIGAGIDYLFNTAYRSIDPRPGIKNFGITLTPEIAWQWGKNILGIMPTWGYGFESTTIAYVNDRYRNNYDTYPERRTWLIMGMGYMQPRSGSNEELDVRSHTMGISINDIYKTSRWTFSTLLSWKRNKAEYYNPKENSLSNSEWGTYTLNDYSFNILAQQDLQHSLSISGNIKRGEDLNTYSVPPLVAALNASNYHYRSENVNVTYGHLRTGDHVITPGWGASLLYESTSKQDFVTAHYLAFSNVSPSVYGELYRRKKTGDRLQVRVSASMRLPVSQEVTVLPTQLTFYSTDVVYHDYYYWSTTTAGAALHAQYITRKLLKTLPLGFTLQLDYNKALSQETATIANVPPVGDSRMHTTFSINLFL